MPDQLTPDRTSPFVYSYLAPGVAEAQTRLVTREAAAQALDQIARHLRDGKFASLSVAVITDRGHYTVTGGQA